MPPGTITIGLPFLNARRTLADAVRSVFAQTYDDWELLLLDDGSSDGSLEMVQRIRDPRVRVISDRVHRGLVARLNQSISLAQGIYYARMDADDLMHPQRLEHQVQFLERNPNVDLVDTSICTIDADNEPLEARGEGLLDSRPAAVLKRGILIHPAVMGRATWFRGHPYDPAFVRAEDRELWSRVCAGTGFARIKECLLFYREIPAGHLANYLSTGRTTRKILRLYGPPLVGSLRTGWLVVESHLKDFAYRACSLLGWQGRLIQRRNRPLSPTEIEKARQIIRNILETSVPGLESEEQPAAWRTHERVGLPG